MIDSVLLSGFKVLAIDGGAASGKSSTSRNLADRLNFLHVDTGLHYRAIAYTAAKSGVPHDSPSLDKFLSELVFETAIEKRSARMVLNGELAQEASLRSDYVNTKVSIYAAVPSVRNAVLRYQRSLVGLGRGEGFAGVVMDGRDIGTVVLPDADLKVFLIADEETRRARRIADGSGEEISARDKLDSRRKTAPLMPAKDAVIIDNSHLTLNEVVAKIISLLSS